MAGSQVVRFKASDLQEGYSIKCRLRGLCVHGGWRLGALVGRFKRRCSARLKETGALPFSREWQFWLCHTGCSGWWVTYFVEQIGADSRRKVSVVGCVSGYRNCRFCVKVKCTLVQAKFLKAMINHLLSVLKTWTWILGQNMQVLCTKADIEARVYLFGKYNAWVHQLMFEGVYQCSHCVLVHYALWSVRITTFEEKLVLPASFAEISLNTWH